MYNYTVESSLQGLFSGKNYLIEVRLNTVHHGGTHNPALAVALLPILNKDFQVWRINSDEPIEIHFRMSKEKSPFLIATFSLDAIEDNEIQYIAEQCQQILSNTMTNAVDLFERIMAVCTVQPYLTRMKNIDLVKN